MSSFRGIGSAPLNDFLFDIASGKVPGHMVGTMFGRNTDLDTGDDALVWDYGHILNREVYLLADTELFVSSTSTSDTNVGIIIEGMTEDYINKKETFTITSGQSQQSVGNWFRIFKTTVITGDAPLGTMYVAESDTLTGGEPNTPAKVHDYMPFGDNRTHKSACTVPANSTVYVTRLFMGVKKGKDAVFTFSVKRAENPAFIKVSDFPVYQSTIFTSFTPPFPIQEKTDFEFTATTQNNNTEVAVNVGYVMVDNSISAL